MLYNRYIMNNDDSSSAALIENIKNWVQYDNQLRLLNEKTKEIRERRVELQSTIIEQLNTQNMQRATINVGDGELKMVAKKDYPPLTYQYVEKCLTDVIPNKEHVDYIISYIKSNREIKESTELRRIPKKI